MLQGIGSGRDILISNQGVDSIIDFGLAKPATKAKVSS
jgi:hypothetical protein